MAMKKDVLTRVNCVNLQAGAELKFTLATPTALITKAQELRSLQKRRPTLLVLLLLSNHHPQLSCLAELTSPDTLETHISCRSIVPNISLTNTLMWI